MSRSYRKSSVSKLRNNQFEKRQANRMVRRRTDFPLTGNGFKKCSEWWDICDYSHYYPFWEYKRNQREFWARLDRMGYWHLYPEERILTDEELRVKYNKIRRK